MSPAALVAVIALVLGAPVRAETVRVLAAASLAEAFGEIARAFEAANPGTRVELAFAGSQVLRTQLEQGAEADVFASADHVHADALESRGLIEAPRVFARNRLVVVTPAERASVAGLEDLARPGVQVVLAAPSVPAGRYALQVLEKLAQAHGGDFAVRVRANVVSQETSVRAVLAKVSLGEADAGFVYRTDAAGAGTKVRTLPIPDVHNVVADYPIGLLRQSRAPAARAFVALVLGPQGRAILARHGFEP